MIVKVQVQLAPAGEAGNRVLIYDQEHKRTQGNKGVFVEMVMDDSMRQLMHEPPNGLRPKAFFYADLENGELVIDKEAPWQGW